MSDQSEGIPTLTGKEFEAAQATLAIKQVTAVDESMDRRDLSEVSEVVEAAATFGQESVTTATNETETVSAAIKEQQQKVTLMSQELVRALKEVEHALRKNYPDPDRIVVPVSHNAVIHQDFRRQTVPIPDHVMFPRPAVVRGKPLKVGDVKDDKGRVFPIYVAAEGDGTPMRDKKGKYVVIDPQSGRLRQNFRATPKPRSRVRVWWALFKAWWGSWHLDLKIVKKG